jgi:hypothetical protein
MSQPGMFSQYLLILMLQTSPPGLAATLAPFRKCPGLHCHEPAPKLIEVKRLSASLVEAPQPSLALPESPERIFPS